MNTRLAVVTGGAGFVGSHLCERLVRDGYRVISLDNYFTGTKENHVPGVDYREGHTKDIAKHISETPDIIYHLGEYSRVAQSIEEPALVLDLNLIGTCGVLEFWREKKCKLIYAGSSTKMSDPRSDGTAGRNLSPYTWAKAANTELVRNYARWYDLPYATAYFFNVYGDRERAGTHGTVIEIFRQATLNHQKLGVRLPGTQRRNYTHVLDTIDGILLVGERGSGDDYCIASEESFSTLEVAQMFGGDIEMLPERTTSRPGTSDINLTRMHELGWSATRHLADYIHTVCQNAS